jgi:6-phospho-3-hexuloisomerase
VVLLIPAATKQDASATKSQQYAGVLFEQSVLLLTDALFQSMWHQLGETAEQLWKRHANLE